MKIITSVFRKFLSFLNGDSILDQCDERNVEPENKKAEALSLEDAVDRLADAAMDIANIGVTGFSFNSRGEFVDAPESMYWETLVNVWDLALRYKETSRNHHYFGHALLCLSYYKVGDEKEQVLRDSIFHLEEANRLAMSYDLLRLIGVASFELGVELEGEERISALSKSEKNLKDYLNKSKGSAVLNRKIGLSIGYLTDELEDFSEREARRRESVSYHQKAVRLDQKDPDSHYYLGEELADLADDVLEPDRKKRIYNHSLRHLQKSYDLDKDEETLKLISEVRQDMSE